MGEDYWGDWMVDRPPDCNPPDLDGFKDSQQQLLDSDVQKCLLKTTKLGLSKIVTPFPVFEENWAPNSVITIADDQGHTLDVKLLESLCFTRRRHKSKVTSALKREKEGLLKSINKGCQSI